MPGLHPGATRAGGPSRCASRPRPATRTDGDGIGITHVRGIMEKLRIGLLFGGRSVEHDVSIVSAASIAGALDRERYELTLIGVDPDGTWHAAEAAGGTSEAALREVLSGPQVHLLVSGETAVLMMTKPGDAGAIPEDALRLDVIFPIIHGRGGEDGALQGLLESADLPYVGSGVLSSAAQMDKDVAKQLLARAGIAVTDWITFSPAELDRDGSARRRGSRRDRARVSPST